MPAILDSLFHKVVNTTSSPIEVEAGGGGEPRSGRTFRYKNSFMAKWLQFRLFSVPHVTNVARSMLSLTSQSCGDSLPAVCLAREVGAIYRPPEHQWTPDRLMNEVSVKVDH